MRTTKPAKPATQPAPIQTASHAFGTPPAYAHSWLRRKARAKARRRASWGNSGKPASPLKKAA